jgi:hypothetical protein
MAYGDPQLLHLDAMLTAISVGYQNEAFIADIFAPNVPVNKQSDKYYVHNHDLWGRVTDDIRAPGARANELPPMTLSSDSYFVEEHALIDVIPIEEQANADNPLSPLTDATERVTNTLLLNREAALVTKYTTAANYNASNTVTLTGTDQWSDYTNSDPVDDVKVGKKRIHDLLFQDPNVMAVQYEVAVKLEDHPDFIERIKYSQIGITTDELIARVFNMPTFRRAGAGKVSSVYGQAETVGYMWPQDVLMAYVPARPAPKTPAFAYTFRWNFETGGDVVTERWFDTERKADVVRVSTRYTDKFIYIDGSSKALGGYLIKDAIL